MNSFGSKDAEAPIDSYKQAGIGRENGAYALVCVKIAYSIQKASTNWEYAVEASFLKKEIMFYVST